MSEMIERRAVGAVGVDGRLVLARAGLVVVEHRQLAYAPRERDRQTARGVVVPEEHVGNGPSLGLSRVKPCDDGVGIFVEPVNAQRTPVEQHGDEGFVGCGGTHGLDHLLLRSRQVERWPVVLLATGEDVLSHDHYDDISGGGGGDRGIARGGGVADQVPFQLEVAAVVVAQELQFDRVLLPSLIGEGSNRGRIATGKRVNQHLAVHFKPPKS